MPTQLETAPNSTPVAFKPANRGRVREGLGLMPTRVLTAMMLMKAMKKTCKPAVGMYFAEAAPMSTPAIMPGVMRMTVCQSMDCFLCCAATLERVVNSITAKDVPTAKCWA